MARAIRISQPARRCGLGGYWRGTCPPWIALVLVLICGRMAVAELWQALPAPLPAPLFATLLCADMMLASWQVVGAWRSLSRGIDARAQGHVLLAGRVAVTVVAVVIATHAIDRAAWQTAASSPVSRVGPQPLEVRNGVAYLTGTIDYDLLARFEATPAARFSELDLDSAGGQVFAARALARKVKAQGVKTRVSKRCDSACTLIFMAGSHRALGPKGELGFHGYLLQANALQIDVAAQEAIDRAFLRDQGVSASFAARAFATPHAEIWRPDRSVLADAGVLSDR